MIMLGSSGDDAFGQPQRARSGPNGPVFQSPYIIVADIENHYQRALAASASIAIALRAKDYGGKVYSCWDPQGQLCNFESYDPWANESHCHPAP